MNSTKEMMLFDDPVKLVFAFRVMRHDLAITSMDHQAHRASRSEYAKRFLGDRIGTAIFEAKLADDGGEAIVIERQVFHRTPAHQFDTF